MIDCDGRRDAVAYQNDDDVDDADADADAVACAAAAAHDDACRIDEFVASVADAVCSGLQLKGRQIVGSTRPVPLVRRVVTMMSAM